MVLVFLVFLTSFACLVISLIALGIVLKHTYLKGESYIVSNSDQAIIITGCDSGIGLELAKYFYNTTNYKVICGFLKSSESDGFKELEILSKSDKMGRLILKQLDLKSNKDIDDIVLLIDELKKEKQIKELVAIINNAGIMAYGEFDWLTWDQIQSQIDVNFIGTLRLTRAILPHIIRSKGRIINVSSVNDTTVFPGLSVYSATKSALSIFSRGIGYELRKFGAHVVTVRLGDFAKLTNIMAGHKTNRDKMWNEMDSNKKILYNDFFHEFNDHLLKNYGMTSPREFEDSSLYHDFRRALLAKSPPTTITCAPLTFKIFYVFVEMIPVWMQYYLLDFLLQFGFRWKAPQVSTRRADESVLDTQL